MLRGLRALLVLTFIALFSHGPFSWGHTHRGLDPQQLHEHLEAYHAGCPDADLPSEWHYHLTWLQDSHLCQFAGSSCPEVKPCGKSALQSIEWLGHVNHTTLHHVDSWAENPSVRQPSPPCTALVARGQKQHETYKLLGVLLI